jgi:hypothetical protein
VSSAWKARGRISLEGLEEVVCVKSLRMHDEIPTARRTEIIILCEGENQKYSPYVVRIFCVLSVEEGEEGHGGKKDLKK